MKNCIVAQSGGPTCAINASLAGVISGCIQSESFDQIFGSLNGILGILNDRIVNLSETVKNDPEFISKLQVTPAMYLGSCRYKLPKSDQDESVYEKIFSFFEVHQIKAFFYIGGNDSMDTVLQLSRYAKAYNKEVMIVGVPKTIDNDLCHTDHTPGFGSAAKYIATTMMEIAYDTSIYPVDSVTIVEIMGRDAGWLTSAASLSNHIAGMGPDYIYLPEVPFSKTQFLQDVRTVLSKKHNVLIAISEGIRDENGNYISASDNHTDSFGHQMLSGAGKALEYLIADELKIKVRSIELNLPQRAAAHIASLTDLNESFAQGRHAVHLAEHEKTGIMVTCKRNEDSDTYKVTYDCTDISIIANEVKSVPLNYINEEKNNVTQEMIDYLMPLIQGEPQISYRNGLPQYVKLP